jgi:hypothetical protein
MFDFIKSFFAKAFPKRLPNSFTGYPHYRWID